MSLHTPIAITGLGAVCGAGLTVEAIVESVLTGRSAIGPITQWDASRWPVKLAAEVVGVDNRTLVEDRKLHKSISRTDMFGLYAAGAAIQQSGIIAHRQSLPEEAVARFNDRSGVIVGSGGGSYNSNYDYFPLLTEAKGDLRVFGRELGNLVNPMWLLRNLPNNVLCHVGIRHGFKGTNACITNQCTGGVLALTEAAAAIRTGEADRAAVVGHDAAIEPETVLHYTRLGLLTPDTVRPFDRGRQGTLFGEGAAAVMMEKVPDALARGATIFGEFLGSGCTNESEGIFDIRSDGDGPVRAMTLALEEAGLTPDQVGMIVAHGNGTRASDASEARAIQRVFGQNPPPVTGFKWSLGHLIAASGVLDLVVALTVLRRGVVPGIASLRELDSAIAPLPVSASPQPPKSNTALLLCRGFGSMNVATVVRAAASPGQG